MSVEDQIDRCLALKDGNKELALFFVTGLSRGDVWQALIGNTSSNVGLGEMEGEFEAEGATLAECLAALEVKLLNGEWRTGWPHDADPSAMVEVEYRNGEVETAQVCEIDWSHHDDDDKWSPCAEREVVRYRMKG